MKMTKLSVENLKVADQIQLFRADDGAYLVRVSRDGNVAFLHSGEGIMRYPTAYHAIRAIARHSSIKPTTI